MQRDINRTTRSGGLFLAAACLVIWPLAVAAQSIGMGGGDVDPANDRANANLPHAGTTLDSIPPTPDPPDPDAAKDAPPPPPALPGSHAQPTVVAPAAHAAGDMEPTTALFDAINRGDTVAVRDAMSRGANLDGKNVLGLTPIELSVDLGRNDISFILLSMHNESVEAEQPIMPPRPGARGHRAVPVSAGGPAAGASTTSGTPSPNDGFLGFGKTGS